MVNKVVNSSQGRGYWDVVATPLRQACLRLDDIKATPKMLPVLEGQVEATSAALLKIAMMEIPAFSESHNPGLLPALDQHIKTLVAQIPKLLRAAGPNDFAFVRAHAQALAVQRFPLEAALHIYRSGLKSITHWISQAALSAKSAQPEFAIAAASDFAIEYINAVSAELTAEYVEQTRALADAEGGRRTELLNILLSGYDESDGRVASLLKRAGYLQQRHSYCVVVVQSTIASEMEHPERVQRIAAALSAAVATSPFRVLVGVHNAVVSAVFSAQRRQSGWTAPQTLLATRLAATMEELGPSVLVGISTDQPSTSSIAKALREAMVALECTTVARRVVQFSGLPLRSLVLHKGGEFVRSVLPHWANALIAADASAHGNLIDTLRAVGAADLNVQAAGRALGLHPNTVYARLDRINDITGLDGRRHHDLVELLLAIDCAEG